MSNTGPMCAARDDEEEDGKTPEPDAHPVRHDQGDDASLLSHAHKVLRYASWEILTHGDDSCNGKARGTNGDEHAGTKRFLWEFLCHQAIQKSGVDH